MEADTKKNCCLRRSSLPYSVASLGYSTELMSSALRFSSTACTNTQFHQTCSVHVPPIVEVQLDMELVSDMH